MAPSHPVQDTPTSPDGRAARRGVLLVAVALLTVACGSSPTAATQPPASATPSRATASATPSGLPSAGSLTTVASSLGTVKAGDSFGIASDGTSVWIYDGDSGVVTRVTAATGAVAGTIQLKPGCLTGRGCGNVAVGDGAVWVANDVDGTITRIDPSSNRVVATVHVAANAGPQVYTTPGAVWSANYFGNSYSRIDAKTNAVVATLTNHLSASSVAYIGGSVWLCDASNTPALTRLDPATGAVQKQIALTTASGSSVFCIKVVQLGSSLYVVPDGGHNPMVVDPATGRTTETTAPGDALVGIVADTAGRTWVLDARLGVVRLDPATGHPAAQISLAGGAGLAGDGHSVWVISSEGTLYRVVPGASS